MVFPRVHPKPNRRAARRGDHASAHRRPRPGDAPYEAGVDDRALYGCGCGLIFEAAVSTSVECPHCGEPQAW
jgi:hypothetical protein